MSPSVLIVEDNVELRQAMSRLLRKCGVEVVEAGSVQEALLLVDRSSHILLDLRLPDGSGLEVLEYIRACDTSQRIMVVTGEGAEGPLMTAAALLSPDAVLRKPVTDFEQIQTWLCT